MGMNVGTGGGADPEVMIDINTTPLIDVMLVLLIMLIITIPVQKHAVKLDMPVDQQNQPPPENPLTPVTLEVDFDGTLYWDGVIIPSHNDLLYRLQELAKLETQPEFHIRPNRLAAYKHVIAVMAAAQRLGVTKMGVIGSS
jgi:biopolymer transport protein ExbD